jgi:hypothetical protein
LNFALGIFYEPVIKALARFINVLGAEFSFAVLYMILKPAIKVVRLFYKALVTTLSSFRLLIPDQSQRVKGSVSEIQGTRR